MNLVHDSGNIGNQFIPTHSLSLSPSPFSGRVIVRLLHSLFCFIPSCILHQFTLAERWTTNTFLSSIKRQWGLLPNQKETNDCHIIFLTGPCNLSDECRICQVDQQTTRTSLYPADGQVPLPTLSNSVQLAPVCLFRIPLYPPLVLYPLSGPLKATIDDARVRSIRG